MTLRPAALVALAATATIFLVRAVATFRPEAFGRPAVAVAAAVVLGLSALAIAVFFLAVRRHSAAPARGWLPLASAGAALGWFATSILGLAGAASLAGFVDAGPPPLAAALVPVVTALFTLAFFAALVAATRGGVLERPALAGLIGTLALALYQAVALVRFLAPGSTALVPEPTLDLAIAASPLGVGAVAAVLWFFWAFAREAGARRA